MAFFFASTDSTRGSCGVCDLFILGNGGLRQGFFRGEDRRVSDRRLTFRGDCATIDPSVDGGFLQPAARDRSSARSFGQGAQPKRRKPRVAWRIAEEPDFCKKQNSPRACRLCVARRIAERQGFCKKQNSLRARRLFVGRGDAIRKERSDGIAIAARSADRVRRNPSGGSRALRGGSRKSRTFVKKQNSLRVCRLFVGRGDAIRTRNLRFWRPLLYR